MDLALFPLFFFLLLLFIFSGFADVCRVLRDDPGLAAKAEKPRSAKSRTDLAKLRAFCANFG